MGKTLVATAANGKFSLIGEYPRTASGAATPIRKINLLSVPGLQVDGMALCN